MHSLKTKILVLILFSMFGLLELMSYVGFHFLNKTVNEDCSSEMKMLINEERIELNSQFNNIERGVMTLSDYIKNNVDTKKLRSDSDYNKELCRRIALSSSDISKIVGDVVAVYFRPDPEVYGSSAGIFMTDNGNGELVRVEPTDITMYSSSDREYVGWYYEPVENGKPTWVKPYYNRNINVYMMSYVVPVYKDDVLLGVVGMDVKMSKLTGIIDSIVYKNGSAFLFSDDGDLIYNKDYPEGSSMKRFNSDMRSVAKIITETGDQKEDISNILWRKESYRVISSKLDNGMIVAMIVPEKEIVAIINSMQMQTIFIFLIVFVVTMVIFFRLMVVIVYPIREITRASTRIAKGELNTTINYKSDDEIGTLAKSVSKMALEIKEYFSYIHSQAYTDAMTGVGNKAAYMDLVKVLEKKIEEGMASFSVIVFDVNGLKRVNDNLGHEYGDMLITDAADILKQIFLTENVYRIGGDEFIVVIENVGKAELDEYFRQFDKSMKEFNGHNVRYEHELAVSKGGVAYDPELDKAYKDVFRRADEIMYKDKEEYYKGRNDRRKR